MFFREDFLGYQEQEGKGKREEGGVWLYAVPVVSLKVDKRRGLCKPFNITNHSYIHG